jgi:uncharacterized protein YbgA (DUF1722 family)/uncharacterized protein YbbK (DUF523 family)
MGVSFPTPVVIVSKCLELDACRYNAQRIRAPLVLALHPHVRLRAICPEVEIGLGVPRDPIKLVAPGGTTRLAQPSTGRDLTKRMAEFGDRFLDSVQEVDGFILKSRSPSCGIKDTKRYADEAATQPAGKGAGMFGEAVIRRFPYAAIEDEERLTNHHPRHHFLTKLFTRAAFRVLCAHATMARLVTFHTANELLLMAYHRTELRHLGRVLANAGGKALHELLAAYEEGLGRALAQPARRASHVNVLLHALGFFAARLTAHEKALFLDHLDQYRENRLPLDELLTVARAWITRFQQPYLAAQTYFEPYPSALALSETPSAKSPTSSRR